MESQQRLVRWDESCKVGCLVGLGWLEWISIIVVAAETVLKSFLDEDPTTDGGTNTSKLYN